ncbi:hypothetical protein Purlil1_130 [Purpureocillium lilacinum]|uniref:Fatty acid hydroxylase domain-containing protein n=1 Tax=Purpureocillium lilacinum TaxID=33203 RepID=A0ABR0CGQ4_PURLI|nr:hypothetical protein Purlil1_130 [Purpureocillium lilacinum]
MTLPQLSTTPAGESIEQDYPSTCKGRPENPALTTRDKQLRSRSSQHRQGWTIYHWFLYILDILPTDPSVDAPTRQKYEKVPRLSDWSMHRWVMSHAIIPIVLQQLYIVCTDRNFTTLQALLFYNAAYAAIAIHGLHTIRRLGHRVDFLDSHAPRDGIPEARIKRLVFSLILTSTLRPTVTVLLTYRTNETLTLASWIWLPVEVGLYGIILDFWFYWYHRLMHEAPRLWKYHRIHHSAHHPNSLLSQYADTEQIFLDLLGVPVLTHVSMKALGLPWGFHQWWICHIYVLFAEWGGHSGLRLYASPPSTFTPVLRWLKCETTIEDHDLHHRRGRRRNGNYGKQTRLWDVVFGTCVARIECRDDNIDWDRVVDLPVF